MRARTPTNETERLAALLGCAILDTPPEPSFDDIARLAGQLCDTPVALVSLVADDRQWFKARVGLELAETSRDVSFCAHAIHSPEMLVVRDTREDERFADNPFVTGEDSIRFYAGVPLVIEPDVAVGTLCVIDYVPRDLTPVQIDALAALARQVSSELKLRRTLAKMRPQGVPTEAPGGHRAVEGRVVDGRYRIERVLGVGGMGIVVAAHDETLHERVAIKFLVSEARGEPEAQERFVREAKAVLKVGGEHVARVLDVGNLGNGAPYIVMEHLDGEDLERRLERYGALTAQEAIAYVLQACTAVGRAHEVGIVHRDLKPANLFLTERADGSALIKVLDFGVSKFSRSSALVEDISLTQGTALLGSPCYMSPEQMRGVGSIDGRADVWAFGVILYELVTCTLPFEGRTFIDLCNAVLSAAPRPIRSRRATIPQGLDAVIERCLAKDRAARYPSIDALVVALTPLVDPSAPVEPLSLEPTPPDPVRFAVVTDEAAAPALLPPSPISLPVVADEADADEVLPPDPMAPAVASEESDVAASLPPLPLVSSPRQPLWHTWFAALALLALLVTVVLIMAGTVRVGR